MRILKFKAKVEAELEADKWERVARMTEDDGGKVMTAREARLRFKEIERNGFQVSAANSDDGLPEVTDADMDAIDRELAGVGDVDGSSLSGLEQSYVDEPMRPGRDVRGEGSETQGLRLGEQKVIESFGQADGHEDVEIDNEARLIDSAAIEGITVVGEGSSKFVQEDSKENIPDGIEVDEGGRGVVDEQQILSETGRCR
jgi:hypothetical protein